MSLDFGKTPVINSTNIDSTEFSPFFLHEYLLKECCGLPIYFPYLDHIFIFVSLYFIPGEFFTITFQLTKLSYHFSLILTEL